MGIRDRLGLGKRTSDLLAVGQQGIKSPLSEGALTGVVFGDLFEGFDLAATLPLSRSQAIAVPVVSKARNLLVATISKFPLVALKGDAVLDSSRQPTFLYRTNTAVNPQTRMAWTIDDLIFHGCSVWYVERSGEAMDTGRRPILHAAWVPFDDWYIEDGTMFIDDTAVSDDDFILFDHVFEGLLTVGNRTLRGARDTEESWVGRARNPIPLINLRQTDDQLTETEVKALVDAWAKARMSKNGAIGSTPPSIEIQALGDVSTDLMVEGRNAVRTDIGSFLNIRASMLDGTAGVDSLTYTTNEGERNQFYEFDLPFWTLFIEARLSMDDVVPRGVRVRFDKYDLYNPPTATGTPTED
ncbi:phage portal protein [Agreia sp. VKM Ac-1783]|uniref:phage portal protein n=1 Tax=Agreia sp. VKM Ac-1783 TaxID=1938889 RepID=UPI000A2AB87F|nr:phage portal protein [Agreia sp. VKM Ac-1783]SMQ73489.1 Phage portal protein [Agreia sp. VKM Ac-1783]